MGGGGGLRVKDQLYGDRQKPTFGGELTAVDTEVET